MNSEIRRNACLKTTLRKHLPPLATKRTELRDAVFLLKHYHDNCTKILGESEDLEALNRMYENLKRALKAMEGIKGVPKEELNFRLQGLSTISSDANESELVKYTVTIEKSNSQTGQVHVETYERWVPLKTEASPFEYFEEQRLRLEKLTAKVGLTRDRMKEDYSFSSRIDSKATSLAAACEQVWNKYIKK